MPKKTPHIVQYQGSKRKLAPQILAHMPKNFNRLVEPFSGVAAISVAAAMEQRANTYIINDLNEPLINMLREAIENPLKLVNEYGQLWREQFSYGENHAKHFYVVRDRFNDGCKTPAATLYLISRCVKGAVRYAENGRFNQSPDKRRHGTNPETLRKNVCAASKLLKGKASYFSLDYREIFEMAQPGDLFYIDPPYQGVTNTKDSRYFSGVPYDEFVEAIEILNNKCIAYLISYDGFCGDKAYGKNLPESLGCKKIMLDAGLSSQSTLLGRKSNTFESLYISSSLFEALK